MTTLVVVNKNGELAIAADSLVTFGDTRLAFGYERNEKIFKLGESYVGIAGTVAHFPVLRKALRELPAEDLKLFSREDVYTTFQKLHPILKDSYFLNSKEDDADPYESSQLTCLIANKSGIYGVYSYREVFEFDKFWSIGSGRSFSLGAMYAVFDQKGITAKEIAMVGVRAGAEFDKSSSAPFQCFTLALDKSAPARKKKVK
jgi:ATP-dependent HslUV protease, peptidase subunit HslV